KMKSGMPLWGRRAPAEPAGPSTSRSQPKSGFDGRRGVEEVRAFGSLRGGGGWRVREVMDEEIVSLSFSDLQLVGGMSVEVLFESSNQKEKKPAQFKEELGLINAYGGVELVFAESLTDLLASNASRPRSTLALSLPSATSIQARPALSFPREASLFTASRRLKVDMLGIYLTCCLPPSQTPLDALQNYPICKWSAKLPLIVPTSPITASSLPIFNSALQCFSIVAHMVIEQVVLSIVSFTPLLLSFFRIWYRRQEELFRVNRCRKSHVLLLICFTVTMLALFSNHQTEDPAIIALLLEKTNHLAEAMIGSWRSTCKPFQHGKEAHPSHLVGIWELNEQAKEAFSIMFDNAAMRATF
ncbi:hypothetical protein HPP92_029066, partial [Vanilla planifolia]